jgi:serine/threonine protein kinase
MTDSSYRVVRRIGIGGMASVYAAERTRPDGSTMPVACKYMRSDLRDHPRLVSLFFQEAALGLALSRDHDGLVRILECFQDADENLCLVMELVDGCTLRDLIDVRGRLPHAAVRAIARHVLSALAYLHARGVVHRDVSPCNVLVSLGGEVKLSDLGLAKLLGSGAGSSGCFRGKPAYASPEQLAGRKVDARSDLFSLGVVLYRMLTGQMPFGSEGDPDVMLERIVNGPPAELPHQVPADLRALTLGLLAAAPEARTPASADAALAGIAGGSPEAPIATDIELAALAIEARARLDAPRETSPAVPETPSSSALTQSWAGPPRSGRRPRRRARRALLVVLLGLAALLALFGAQQVRGLLGLAPEAPPEPTSEAITTRPRAPAPVTVAPPAPPGRADVPAIVAPERAVRDVRVSGKSTAGEHAPPPRQTRPRNTAPRAPSRYFDSRD